MCPYPKLQNSGDLKYLKGLFDNFIEMSRENIDLFEANRIINELESEESRKEVEVSKILKDVYKEYKCLASRRGIEIRYNLSRHKVLGGSLLKELFSHIIENAIIHSEGKLVRIKNCECVYGMKVIIEDDGRGIPRFKREKIFEKFWSGKGEIGSGLGLYLSKLIVESYGGNIEIKSSSLGGAKFEVKLETP